jgi:hypothetical protein
MIPALLFALVAAASGQIEFEMSVDSAVNESTFVQRAAQLAQKGRELNTTANTSYTGNSSVLPLLVLAKAAFNVTRVIAVLCVENVGCFNDLPPPAPPPSRGVDSVLIGVLCGLGVLCLGIVVLLIVLLRKPPQPEKTLNIRLPPRNRGWTVG